MRVGHEGEWFQVRAPERLGAWVPLESLIILCAEPTGWAEEWKSAATARAPRREEPPAPNPPPTPVPVPPSQEPTPAVGTDAPATAAGAAASVATPAAKPHNYPPAQVAKDPARWLTLAHQDLAAYRAGLTASFDGWSDPRAEEFETTFSTVLWHGTLAADLESARRGLASLDALRRSYGAWLASEEHRARVSGDTGAAARWAVRQEALARSWGSDGEGGALLIGWVEVRQGAQTTRPFALTRNGQSAIVHDFEDRWQLSDFVGRELVARGTWRAEVGAPGGRVLAVSELRVLPSRRSRGPQPSNRALSPRAGPESCRRGSRRASAPSNFG